MPTVELDVAYRPIRVGFLLRQGMLEDICRAATLCTGVWGGISNVLVPVTEEGDNDLARTLIRRFLVDALFPVTRTPAIDQLVDAHAHLRWPHFFASNPLYSKSGEAGQTEFAVLDVDAPLKDYWRSEGRHAGGPTGILPEWQDDDPLAAYFAVSFGRFPSDDEDMPNCRGSFTEATRAWIADLGTGGMPAGAHSLVLPIDATGYRLQHPVQLPRYERELMIGDPRDADALTTFWNIRASGENVRMAPVEESDLPRIQPWLTEYVKQMHDAPHAGISLIAEDAHSPDGWVLPAHFDWLASVQDRVHSMVGSRYWTTHGFPGSLPPHSSRTSVLASFEDKYEGKAVVAPLANRPFVEDKPRTTVSKQWVVSLQTRSSVLPDDRILRLPFLPTDNEWFSRQLSPASPWSLRLQPEGLDFIDYVWRTSLDIFPITHKHLASRIFERAGITCSISTPGQLGERIFETVGGRINVFRIRGVRKLLESTAARNGVTREQALSMIRDIDPTTRTVSFQKYAQQFAWKDIRETDIFAFLLEREVLSPAVVVTCPKCLLKPRIDVDRLGRRVACTYCWETFLLAPRLQPNSWVFRLSGVFEREGGPQGAIPSLLAISELRRRGSGDLGFFLTAQDLRGPFGVCETDLVWVDVSRDGAVSVCIAESKDQGHIDEADVENLNAVRTVLRASGVDCFLLFSVLRDSFDETELALFRGLEAQYKKEEFVRRSETQRASSLGPILLTAQELEGDPWSAAPAREGLPHAHPYSLAELAENSSAAYLDSASQPG